MKSSEELCNKGLEYYNKSEYSQAVSYFRQAAEMGDVNAQLKLGGCYWEGKGVEWNVREALKWHKKAAEQGNSEDQYFYGTMCLSGEAVDELGGEIIDEGIEWLEKAAAQGHIEAKKAVARLKPTPVAKPAYTPAPKPATPTKSAYIPASKPVAAAKPVPAVKPSVPNLTAQQWYDKAKELSQANNRAEAYKCYLRAAEMGHSGAMCSTGICLLAGKGVSKDYKAAFAWFQKSADSGYIGAFQNLADCYRCGIGVPRDLRKAKSLYSGRNDYEVSVCNELIADFDIIGNVAPFTGLPDYDDGYVIRNDIGIENFIKLLNHKCKDKKFGLRCLEFENDLFITATLYVSFVGNKKDFNDKYGNAFKYQSRLDDALERDYNNSGASEFMHIVEYRDDYRREDYERAKGKIDRIVARNGREEFLKSALISLDAKRCNYNIIGTKNGKSRRIRKIILNWLE